MDSFGRRRWPQNPIRTGDAAEACRGERWGGRRGFGSGRAPKGENYAQNLEPLQTPHKTNALLEIMKISPRFQCELFRGVALTIAETALDIKAWPLHELSFLKANVFK